MKCPNCSAEIFLNDKFCGECGEKVEHLTKNSESENGNTESEQIHTSNGYNASNNEMESFQSETAPAGGSAAMDKGNAMNSYVSSGLELVKTSFKNPGKMIGSKDYFPPAITASVIGILVLLFSVLTFIFARSSTSDAATFYGGTIVPASMLIQLFMYTLLLFALFFGILFALNALVIENSVPWQKALNDYAVSSIVVISFYIFGMILEMIRLYEIGAIFLAIGGLLFAFAPLYIFLRYAENNNTKFDSFYSLVLYIIFSAIAYYIVARIIIAQIADSALGSLLNTF